MRIKVKARNIVLFFILLTTVTGCSPAAVATSTGAASQPQNEAQIASTSAPTEMPAPTAMPTPEIPVKIGTTLPVSDSIFNNENINTVQEIGVTQNGLRITRMTADFKNVFIADRSGVTLCEMAVEKASIPSGIDAFDEDEIIIPCKKILNRWDVQVRLNEEQTFSTNDFVITPSGSHFLAVTDEAIEVFDREGNPVGTVTTPTANFKVALSDDAYVALAADGAVQVIDAADGQTVFEDSGTGVAYSPDGKFLAVQKRMAIYLYSTSDWSQVYEFTQDADSGWAFSSNGQWIANFIDKDLVIHSLVDGEYSHTIRDLTMRNLYETATRYTKYTPTDLVLSNEGEFVIGTMILQTESEEYRTFSASSYTELAKDTETKYNVVADIDTYSIYTIIDTANVAIDDEFHRVYHLGIEKPWKYLAETQKFYFSKYEDALLYTTYPDKPYTRENELCIITSELDVVCQSHYLRIDSEGNFLTTSNDRTAVVKAKIDADASESGMLFESYNNLGIFDVKDANLTSYSVKALNEKYHSFIGGYKGDDRVVDYESGEILRTWKTSISQPVMSANSDYVAFLYSNRVSGGYSRIGYYDFINNKFQLLHYETRASSFAFTDDSTKLLGIENESTKDGIDKIIAYDLSSEDTPSPETVVEFDYQEQPETGRLNSLTISSDDSLIVAGTDNGYLLAFDLEDGSLIYQWPAHENASILAVAFSPDGNTIYSSSEYGEIKVWGSEPLEWDIELE
jgi:WD40 repeat protein